MLIIDKKEAILWLSKHGLLDAEENLSFSGFLEPLSFVIPTNSGKKTVLSKMITSLFDVHDEALLWINEFGIWPSAEDWNLFESFRKSLGEHSQLFEKPYHIFSNKDLGSVGSLLSMVFYFYWGALVISPAKNLVIKISHDEVMEVFAKDKEHLSAIQERLNKILQP